MAAMNAATPRESVECGISGLSDPYGCTPQPTTRSERSCNAAGTQRFQGPVIRGVNALVIVLVLAVTGGATLGAQPRRDFTGV